MFKVNAYQYEGSQDIVELYVNPMTIGIIEKKIPYSFEGIEEQYYGIAFNGIIYFLKEKEFEDLMDQVNVIESDKRYYDAGMKSLLDTINISINNLINLVGEVASNETPGQLELTTGDNIASEAIQAMRDVCIEKVGK